MAAERAKAQRVANVWIAPYAFTSANLHPLFVVETRAGNRLGFLHHAGTRRWFATVGFHADEPDETGPAFRSRHEALEWLKVATGCS